MTRHVRNALVREEGFALVTTMAVLALMGLLSITLIGVVQADAGRSRDIVVRDGSFQAAEAGTYDYISKLVLDRMYYAHYLHPGEATRVGADGTTASANAAWTGALTWSYPTRDAWRPTGDGYEYDLKITAPTAATRAVGIVATGRPVGSSNPREWAVLETYVRPSSVSDFQMLANADITYGSTATTYGKIYAGRDSRGINHNVTHTGVAHADVYAEGRVYGPPALMNGARTYDRSNIRTVIKNPINFNDFLTSLVDIQRAAQMGGIFLNNTAADAWLLTFQASGTVLVQACVRTSGLDVALVRPTCGASVSYAVPSNGAIYAAQKVITYGQVNGRVTIASNVDVVVGDNISYVQPGDDVLGLVAANNVIIAQWAPYNLSWRAATISQSGAWRSYSNDGSKGTMTFLGSTTTNLGGSMAMYRTRVYQYDETLAYLQPPWFPTLEDAYTIVLSRSLTPTADAPAGSTPTGSMPIAESVSTPSP